MNPDSGVIEPVPLKLADEFVIEIFQVVVGALVFFPFLYRFQILIPDLAQFISVFHMVFLTGIIYGIGDIDIFKLHLIQQHNGPVDIGLRLL